MVKICCKMFLPKKLSCKISPEAHSYGIYRRYTHYWVVVQFLLVFAALLSGCGKGSARSSERSAEKIIQNSNELPKSKKTPIYQYYQKIPRMTGVTNDPENMIFDLQIELGYEVGDVKTLEKLSKFGAKIAGDVRANIAAKTKIYLGDLDNYKKIENDILDLVNNIIAPSSNDKARVKDVILIELFLHDYR